MNRLINKNIYLYFLLIIIFSNDAASQSNQVPFHIQAAFFGKIFNHISPLKNINPIKVLIVYSEKTESDKTIFLENMKQLGYTVKAVNPVQLVMNISDYNVVYFMPGLQKHAALCKEKKILSICGIPEYVENNIISIALGIENDKPRIYLNISLLQAEGKDVSADLLNISHVF